MLIVVVVLYTLCYFPLNIVWVSTTILLWWLWSHFVITFFFSQQTVCHIISIKSCSLDKLWRQKLHCCHNNNINQNLSLNLPALTPKTRIKLSFWTYQRRLSRRLRLWRCQSWLCSSYCLCETALGMRRGEKAISGRIWDLQSQKDVVHVFAKMLCVEEGSAPSKQKGQFQTFSVHIFF